MSKKKKKNNQSKKTAPQSKPEAEKIPRGNPENIIMVEIPDPQEDKAPEQNVGKTSETEGAASADPKKKREHETSIAQKASKAVSGTIAFFKEKASALIGKVKSAKPPVRDLKHEGGNTDKSGVSEKSTKPEKNDDPGTNNKPGNINNPENTITIELPDSEAEKVMTVVPQVTAEEKPPLTPEQIAAKKHHTRIVLSKTADIVLLVVLIIAGLLILFPIFFAAVQSLKSTSELGETPQTFFPEIFTLESFGELLTSAGKMGVPFYRFVFNTVFISVVVAALRIAVTLPAAYVLAKVKAPMIKTFNRIVEWSLALTPALAFVLNYVLLAKTALADTYFAMILPFITSPLCLILIRGAIRQIPDDMILAARLEGASHPVILQKLVAPQVRPAIAATVILSLLEMGRISGGVLTFSETLDTLPEFMKVLGERGAAGEMYALAVLMLIPAAVLIVIFRKSILRTMTTAALKDEG